MMSVTAAFVVIYPITFIRKHQSVGPDPVMGESL